MEISGDMMKKLETMEAWFCRNISLGISWKDRLTNEDVYRRMNIHKSLLIVIVYMHIRNNTLLHTPPSHISSGKIGPPLARVKGMGRRHQQYHILLRIL